jgi:hypothetical protein
MKGLSNGDCFVGVYNPVTEHLQKIIDDINYDPLINKRILSLKGKCKTPLDLNKIYLAPYNKDNDTSYYRAKITSTMPSSTNMFDVTFMDFGCSGKASANDLIKAEEVDHFLTLFPPQVQQMLTKFLYNVNNVKCFL